MRRTLIRIILSLVSLLVIISVVIIGLGFYTARSTFPQVEGEIQVTGLDSPVEVYRDEYGVPHIYAINDHDLFFTQGYVHAQDRFWQMDF
jgi:penicillin amidase